MIPFLAVLAFGDELLDGEFVVDGATRAWQAMRGSDDPTAPVWVVLEGDGSRCQPYRRALWQAFLAETAGPDTVVRPIVLANARCGSGEWRRSRLADRVREVEALVPSLRAAGLGGPLILVGHSAGAKVAVKVGAAHPDQIAGLVSLAGGLDALAATLREQSDDVDALLATVRASADDDRMWRRTVGFWKEMLFDDYPALWRSSVAPVLVVHGTADPVSPPALVRRAQEELAADPRFTFVWLEGEGHDLLDAEGFAVLRRWWAGQR